MADVVKISSFRSYMTDPACNTIQGLTVTGNNYSIELLKSQFKQDDLLGTKSIQEIDTVTMVCKEFNSADRSN